MTSTTTQPAELPALSDEQIASIYACWSDKPGASYADLMRESARAALAATGAQAQAGQAPAEGDGDGPTYLLRLIDDLRRPLESMAACDLMDLHKRAADMLALRYTLAAKPQPKGAVDGYALLPLRATQEMQDAGRAALSGGGVPLAKVWRVMAEVAAQAPAPAPMGTADYLAQADMQSAAYPANLVCTWPEHNRKRYTVKLYAEPTQAPAVGDAK